MIEKTISLNLKIGCLNISLTAETPVVVNRKTQDVYLSSSNGQFIQITKTNLNELDSLKDFLDFAINQIEGK